MTHIAHKIELKPNHKAQAHFKSAFGVARFAYNEALAMWKQQYELGNKPTTFSIQKLFNARKRVEFPFVMEVSKCVAQYAVRHLGEAFTNFFNHKARYPQFKRKRELQGSFTIESSHFKVRDSRYLKINRLQTPIKLTETPRFNGKLTSVTISQRGDKYYVSFAYQISITEWLATHPAVKRIGEALGIDLGLKAFATLSNGLKIHAPKPLYKLAKRLTRQQRNLARSPRPRTKGEASGSNRVKKIVKLNRTYQRIQNIRKDFTHKLSSALARSYTAIAVEDLNVKGMMRNHRLSRAIGDASFAEFLTKLAYKCKLYETELIVADRFYPSTKTCSRCGSTKEMSLSDRVYKCDHCGMELDRDLNASLNLVKLVSQIGGVPAELTPEDSTALQGLLAINALATSEVETGIQQ